MQAKCYFTDLWRCWMELLGNRIVGGSIGNKKSFVNISLIMQIDISLWIPLNLDWIETKSIRRLRVERIDIHWLKINDVPEF